MDLRHDVVGGLLRSPVGAVSAWMHRGGRFSAVLACLISISPVLGQTATRPALSDPPLQRGSRLTYDPTTDSWKVVETPQPGTEDGDLDIVRQHIARMDFRKALDLVEDWIKQYGPASPRYPEALYLRGTAELELGDYRDAHEVFGQLLNEYPGSEYAEKALSAEFRIAEQYLAGKRRKAFFGLLRVRDREAGVNIMDDIVTNYSDTPLAEYAQLAKANYFYSRGEFREAQAEFAAFARDFPRSRYHAYALIRSGEAALATYPGVHFDDSGLIEAQELFSQFMQRYPQVARERNVPTLMEQIASARADKIFEIGRHYEKYRQPRAARYYYRHTVERWPDTAAAQQARGRLAALGEPIDTGEPMPTTAPAPAQGGG